MLHLSQNIRRAAAATYEERVAAFGLADLKSDDAQPAIRADRRLRAAVAAAAREGRLRILKVDKIVENFDKLRQVEHRFVAPQDRRLERDKFGDTTLFIDYLGIDRETRVAELIFEAKAWNASWVMGQNAYRERPANEVWRPTFAGCFAPRRSIVT